MARESYDPGEVLAALARYPPLPVSHGRIAVVGGFVRDVWLRREPRELDVVVEGDAGLVARSLGGEVVVHEPFGTATATGEGWRVDVAMARRERYRAPGALPQVEPASIEEDLARRDFTVNAIAVTLDGRQLAADRALEDLRSATLRVLHERSFSDDPTRLLRLARYAQRLGFAVEPHTAELAGQASLEGLSAARLGGEVRLALAEEDPLGVLARVADRLPIAIDAALVQRALALAPAGSDNAMLMLGLLTREPGWLARLELTAREHSLALACHRARPPAELTPSRLWRAWHGAAVEVVAAAGARGGEQAAREWLDELRHVRLEIGGEDLLAAGLEEGPAVGRALERALEAKLDGELSGGHDAELAYALEVAGRCSS
jgi:tRNA nucleotidyltransferase (CCA-adding enzyme)